jgi:hypothetical protein
MVVSSVDGEAEADQSSLVATALDLISFQGQQAPGVLVAFPPKSDSHALRRESERTTACRGWLSRISREARLLLRRPEPLRRLAPNRLGASRRTARTGSMTSCRALCRGRCHWFATTGAGGRTARSLPCRCRDRFHCFAANEFGGVRRLAPGHVPGQSVQSGSPSAPRGSLATRLELVRVHRLLMGPYRAPLLPKAPETVLWVS